MRKNGRKTKLAYSFLEVFLVLSIFSVLLGVIFVFPIKVLNRMNSVQTSDNFITLYEKISHYIQQALSITLKDNTVLELKLHANQILRIEFISKQYARRKNTVGCYLPNGVRMEWYYERNVHEWQKLLLNETYDNLKFLKVIFFNSKNKVLEQFVFSCYAMHGNGYEE